MNPLLPVGGLVALYLLTQGKGAKAAPSTSPYGQQLPGSTAQATPEPPPPARSHTEMSEGLKKQVAEALARLGVHPLTGKLSGTATAADIGFATQTVGLLQSQGFYNTAASLQRYANEAAKTVPTPAAAKPIVDNAPPGLTDVQKAYIARVFSLERNPAAIETFIRWLKTLPASSERDDTIAQAQALKLQLLAAQSTAETLDKIDQVQKAPTTTAVAQAAKPLPAAPPAPAPVATKPLPQATALPAAPPPAPPPRPPPPTPKTAVEVAADSMVENLRAVQSRYGGAKAAKGKESRSLVKKFQGLAGLKADGLAGRNTLIVAAAKGAVDLPLVMYWPRSARASTVQQYRDALATIASQFDGRGQSREAAAIRASAARERGQAGIVGPLLA